VRSAAILLMLLSVPAAAQELPPASPGQSGRFLTLDYAAGGLFLLPTADGTTQTVIFAPGEAIQSVVVSDPAAYAVGVSGSGDSMTVAPNGASGLAILSVRTNRRSYDFELIPGQASTAPKVVRFSYAAGAVRTGAASAPGAMPEGVSYRQSGDRSVRPATISDDGERTYITWEEDQAMPAVFAIGPSGKEEMVEGYVRGGIFTIDRVYGQLVFRIDQDEARARRLTAKQKRR
jgi:type IV secretion system protein VirB9